MKPLTDWPIEQRRQIIGVFTDIDDTLTTEGRITADALQALANLKQAGLAVIAITGRPVGWCEDVARDWPLDAIVAENGSVALLKPVFKGKNSQNQTQNVREQLSKLYQTDAALRAKNFTHLSQTLARIEREVPGAQRSTDSAGRETDIAIDHSEFTHLPQEKIDAVLRIMQSECLQTSVSSIHINGWIGSHNKRQGAHWIVRVLYGRDLSQEQQSWAFVGDSSNDALMFETFDNSVGVANIARFLPNLKNPPRYVTEQERGAGFAQFAKLLLCFR